MGEEQKPGKPVKKQEYTPGFGQRVLRILAGQHVDAIPDAAEAAEALNRGEAVVINVRNVFSRIAAEQQAKPQTTKVKPKAGS